MAVTFTQLAAITNSTSNTTSYAAGAAGTPAAGDLLLCFVSASDTIDIGTMTGTFTWTKLTSYTKNAGLDSMYVFWAYATGATSTTPTFACAGDAATGAIIYCLRVSGSEGQTVPSIKQFKTNSGSTTNPSVTMNSTISSSNGLVGFVTNGTNSAVQFTAPSGWTENAETSYNTPTNGGEIASISSGQTGSTITWTCANTTPWGAIVLELWAPRNRSLGGGISITGPLSF